MDDNRRENKMKRTGSKGGMGGGGEPQNSSSSPSYTFSAFRFVANETCHRAAVAFSAEAKSQDTLG